MTNSIFSGVSLKARFAVWSMTIGAIAVPTLLMVTLGRSEPIARNSVFGCYTANNSPALLIRNDAVHTVEPALRTLDYVAEASKTSYQLNVRPALALATQSNGRYAFVEQQGTGYFWPLLPANGKNRNRIRHPKEFSGLFEVYATDGARITYRRVSGSKVCRNVG